MGRESKGGDSGRVGWVGFPPRAEEFPSMSLVGPEKRVLGGSRNLVVFTAPSRPYEWALRHWPLMHQNYVH